MKIINTNRWIIFVDLMLKAKSLLEEVEMHILLWLDWSLQMNNGD